MCKVEITVANWGLFLQPSMPNRLLILISTLGNSIVPEVINLFMDIVLFDA